MPRTGTKYLLNDHPQAKRVGRRLPFNQFPYLGLHRALVLAYLREDGDGLFEVFHGRVRSAGSVQQV